MESGLVDTLHPPAFLLERDPARPVRVTPESQAAAEVAARFWARVAGETHTLEQVALAAERVHTQLRTGLGRWIGAEGYRALVDRALAVAEPAHPSLGRLAFLGGDEPPSAAEQADKASELSAGMIALIAAELELLGYIVGDEMALRLMDQIGTPRPRTSASDEPEREPNG